MLHCKHIISPRWHKVSSGQTSPANGFCVSVQPERRRIWRRGPPIQPGPWSFPRERLLTQGSTKCKEADNFDYTPSMFSSTICVESTLPGFWRPTLLDALDHLYLARKVSESLLLSKTEFDLILLTWFFMGWDHIFSMAQDYHPKASWFQISKDNFVSPYP